MKRCKWIFFFCMMVFFMFVFGCWDKRELIDLVVIFVIGIDWIELGKYVFYF